MIISTYELSNFYSFPSITTVVTPLNPIEDLLSWISGLNSVEYNSDILKQVHRFTDKREIKDSANFISLLANNSVGLIEQAYSGPIEVSFLPLYYSILNLSKISIIISGSRDKLIKNKYHGASYNPNKTFKRIPIEEYINIKPNGILPLFYKILTGIDICSITNRINLLDMYQFIPSISHEYSQAFNKYMPLTCVILNLKKDKENKFYLEAKLIKNDHPNSTNKNYIKLLQGFTKTLDQNTYTSKHIVAKNDPEARQILLKMIRSYLIHEPIMNPDHSVGSFITPICNKRLLLPEEIPIWLIWPAAYILERLIEKPPITTQQLIMLQEDNICDIKEMLEVFDLHLISLKEALQTFLS